MSGPDPEAVLAALLDRHGRTAADEAGLRLQDARAPLFGLLVLSSLVSSGVSSGLGVRAARALRAGGLTSAQHLLEAGEQGLHAALTEARFLRTRQAAHQLVALAAHAQDRWGGDLRRLRDAAVAGGPPGDGTETGTETGTGGDEDGGGTTARTGALLQEFAGVGPVAADAFRREVQAVWPHLRPFADARATTAAERLGLPGDAAGLAALAGDEDLSLVAAALVRCSLARDADAVLAGAGRGP